MSKPVVLRDLLRLDSVEALLNAILARLDAQESQVRSLAQAQEGLLRAERWEARGAAIDRQLALIEARLEGCERAATAVVGEKR